VQDGAHDRCASSLRGAAIKVLAGARALAGAALLFQPDPRTASATRALARPLIYVSAGHPCRNGAGQDLGDLKVCAGVVVGNMRVRNIGILGYGALFPVIALLVARVLTGSLRPTD